MRAFDALVGDVYELALEKGEIVFGRSEIWTGRIELDEGEAGSSTIASA